MSNRDWLRFWVLGLIWGTSFLWIKIALAEVSPLVLVSFRTLFATLGLVAVLWLGRVPRLRWRELVPWLGIFMILGLFNIALPFVLISWSELYINSGLASILNSTVPLFTMIVAPFVLHDDALTPPRMLGLGVGFAGVVLLFLPSLTRSAGQTLVGQGAMLLAACSYAMGGIYARRKTQGLLPQLQAFLQLGMATLIMWPFTLVVEQPTRMPHLPLTWLAILWLGLLGSCIAYMLYFSLLHSVGPTRTAMVSYVPPLIGVLLGTIFLGEQSSWQALVGGLMIVSGIAVANLKRRSLPSRATVKRDNSRPTWSDETNRPANTRKPPLW